MPDPTKIQPRQWLYGRELIRGFVSILVSPGGTGKTAYAMAVAACCALKRNLLGSEVYERVNCAVFNLEDPSDELDRRLAAIMLHYDIKKNELDGRYFIHSYDSRSITMAKLADDGFTVLYPDEDALIAQFLANEIGVAVVDPFSESHTLEENSNPHMVKAMAVWRRVARETGAAILLVHHVRKGTSLDIEAARGAKAVTDSARIGLLMTPMASEEAEAFGIKEEDHTAYVRLDNAKANMAPRASEARWFHLVQLPLGNTRVDPLYPSGDMVAAIEKYVPPTCFEGMGWDKVISILEAINEGPSQGEHWSPSRQGRSTDRWVGNVICELGDRTENQALMLVKIWTREKVLITGRYHSKASRREIPCIMVDAHKLSEMRVEAAALARQDITC